MEYALYKIKSLRDVNEIFFSILSKGCHIIHPILMLSGKMHMHKRVQIKKDMYETIKPHLIHCACVCHV